LSCFDHRLVFVVVVVVGEVGEILVFMALLAVRTSFMFDVHFSSFKQLL
jgi:hypothetical protein